MIASISDLFQPPSSSSGPSQSSGLSADLGLANLDDKSCGLATQFWDSQPTQTPLAPPPPFRAIAMQPDGYALSDEQYTEWKAAFVACGQAQSDPEVALVALRAIANKPRLLNWRSPVSGQTLLHELVARRACSGAISEAIALGCDCSLPNGKGDTVVEHAQRKGLACFGQTSQQLSTSMPAMQARRRFSKGVANSLREAGYVGLGQSAQVPELPSSKRSLPPQQQRQAGGYAAAAPLRRDLQSQRQRPPQTTSSLTTSQQGQQTRKRGKQLAVGEVASVPKARLNVEFDVSCDAENLDRAKLESAIQKTYGSKARVQLDDVRDNKSRSLRSNETWNTVSYRVMYDNAEDAREMQSRSAQASSMMQAELASELQLSDAVVEFDGPAKLAEVDAITLKLDSDSASILCGACLVYTNDADCEKVVCYTDRSFEQSIQHSGDTQVDGKSVHTINIVLSQVPSSVSQLYFSLCSCGPDDLSGFRNPSIMLYDRCEPDANLLEYSIHKAGASCSSIIARMIRQPIWTKGDQQVIAHILRRLRMPWLCIDLCLYMGSETSWCIQALGTSAWNLPTKICNNYRPAKGCIENNMRSMTSNDVRMVGLKSSTPQ